MATSREPNCSRWALSDDQIAYRIKLGRLHRVYWGVYSVGRPPRTALEWAAAAVLACGEGAALSHYSALALWSWPIGDGAASMSPCRETGDRAGSRCSGPLAS